MSSESDISPEDLNDEIDMSFGVLNGDEAVWRDRQLFLQSHGYMLRPRLRPGWKPSWISPTGRKDFMLCEDAVPLPPRAHLVDATRMSDSTLVYIKRVKTGDNESTIASYLHQESLRHDPRNHSVPILDLFEDTDDPTISYMVMPFLSLADTPSFETVEEVVEFCDQILEGLVFLHEKGVAHRDCARKNLMMDASSLFPQGRHPIYEKYLPDDITTVAPRLSRTAAGGVKYYFIDYGISSFFPQGVPRLVLGKDGRDREVPELSHTVPYDPFKVDIFIIGNVFRHQLHDCFSNLGFLVPMIELMVQPVPEARPTAAHAWEAWKDIRHGISPAHRSWRLRSRSEPLVVTTVLDSVSLVKFGYNTTRWALGFYF